MRTRHLPTAGIFTEVGFAIGNAKNGFCGSVLRIWIGRDFYGGRFRDRECQKRFL